ncbi:TetR/AcrR family transcriptional regulator [Thalassolituus sp. LLYu03]|uniref:TetR/AcrR family transcriptional regulator n=1 Tax=Thalassolituus sp. LLYu03 TaxID=3421656 RepID=UPI003D2CFB84
MTDEAMDHRTRVGQERRLKMRSRLIESALTVFAVKGADASVIDDVISAAGVARGTFYNYFKTNAELVTAIGETTSNELVALIEEHVEDMEDPLEILATGLRLFLHTARACPTFARFLWRAGFNISAAGHLIYQYLPVHIQRAMQGEHFRVKDVATAIEVMVGTMLAAIFGLSVRNPEDDYPERMVCHALLAFGIPQDKAQQLVSLSLPSIAFPPESLLQRMMHAE